ncbi:hypothetical protein HDA32_005474 [Spinactinospora alkalitolerans]|uniref:Uncharacterized protein n=1 Tax=Spinactinospora alkalitolerans TaxID=687207 RepID=A0A852U8E9_9ACTN|nr:hypothetical protein [Spinactinospora alkalitolerans]
MACAGYDLTVSLDHVDTEIALDVDELDEETAQESVAAA